MLSTLVVGCQNSNKLEDNATVEELSLRTFYVKEVNLDIRYPSKLRTRPVEQNNIEPDRAGSLSAVNFYLVEKDVQLMEVLFHTEKSCSEFYDEDSELEGDFFAEYWYSPQEFIKQRQAFQKKEKYGEFDFVKFEGVEFLFNCGLTDGETLGECITFKNDLRILTTFSSLRECAEVSEQMKSLYSKLKFQNHNH
jgi:hypothetical protein